MDSRLGKDRLEHFATTIFVPAAADGDRLCEQKHVPGNLPDLIADPVPIIGSREQAPVFKGLKLLEDFFRTAVCAGRPGKERSLPVRRWGCESSPVVSASTSSGEKASKGIGASSAKARRTVLRLRSINAAKRRASS